MFRGEHKTEHQCQKLLVCLVYCYVKLVCLCSLWFDSLVYFRVPLFPIPLCLQVILRNLFSYLNVGHLCPVASYLFLSGVYILKLDFGFP